MPRSIAKKPNHRVLLPPRSDMDLSGLRTYIPFVSEHPQNIKRLIGSKWTCHVLDPGDDRPTHYEVVDYSGVTGECRLRSVRLLREKTIPWRQLRERAHWTPGWRSGALSRTD